jgi:hypothetical protein
MRSETLSVGCVFTAILLTRNLNSWQRRTGWLGDSAKREGTDDLWHGLRWRRIKDHGTVENAIGRTDETGLRREGGVPNRHPHVGMGACTLIEDTSPPGLTGTRVAPLDPANHRAVLDDVRLCNRLCINSTALSFGVLVGTVLHVKDLRTGHQLRKSGASQLSGARTRASWAMMRSPEPTASIAASSPASGSAPTSASALPVKVLSGK